MNNRSMVNVRDAPNGPLADAGKLAGYSRSVDPKKKEHNMRSVVRRSVLLVAIAAMPLIAGCATRDSVEMAQATANQALSTAQAAANSAQQAQASATQANQTAGTAQMTAQNAQASPRRLKRQRHRHRPTRGRQRRPYPRSAPKHEPHWSARRLNKISQPREVPAADRVEHEPVDHGGCAGTSPVAAILPI